MLIRPNTPSWNRPEIRQGLLALSSGPSRDTYRGRLRARIEEQAAGWNVSLLASGRWAVALAARSLDLAGRRVAVPGYVCPSVWTGLRAAGVDPVPIDCLPQSIRFDPEALLLSVRLGRVDGVLAANTYGCDQDFALLKRLPVPTIDDAAYQAGCIDASGLGACGMRGDAGVWSLNFKALAGIGGGVLFTRKPVSELELQQPRSTATEIRRFADYAVRTLLRHRVPRFLPGGETPSPELTDRRLDGWLRMLEGGMSELQAAVGLAQWERRTALARVREAVATKISAALAETDVFAALDCSGGHFMPVLVRVAPQRAEAAVLLARRRLHSQGVQTEAAYPMTLMSHAPLGNARDLAQRLFLLPCNPSLGETQVRRLMSGLRTASREVAATFGAVPATTLQ